jgi:hypothetical protein
VFGVRLFGRTVVSWLQLLSLTRAALSAAGTQQANSFQWKAEGEYEAKVSHVTMFFPVQRKLSQKKIRFLLIGIFCFLLHQTTPDVSG